MEKVLFALDIEDGWPPVGTEGVWCEKSGDKYQLKNTPFFIENIAYNDIFKAEKDPVNEHIFEFEIIERSGHSVAWFMNNKSIDISGFKQSILALGCSHEGFPQFSLGAIDVPPDVNFDLLNDIIDLYEELGLDFAFLIWNDPNQ